MLDLPQGKQPPAQVKSGTRMDQDPSVSATSELSMKTLHPELPWSRSSSERSQTDPTLDETYGLRIYHFPSFHHTQTRWGSLCHSLANGILTTMLPQIVTSVARRFAFPHNPETGFYLTTLDLTSDLPEPPGPRSISSAPSLDSSSWKVGNTNLACHLMSTSYSMQRTRCCVQNLAHLKPSNSRYNVLLFVCKRQLSTGLSAKLCPVLNGREQKAEPQCQTLLPLWPPTLQRQDKGKRQTQQKLQPDVGR